MSDRSNLDILSADDTIAAVATAPGVGAIGIVRISGPQALAVAQKCFCSERQLPGDLPDRQLVHGQWAHPNSGESVDEVLVAVMRAPRSYTGEDVLEVYGHGGPVVLRQVLSAALAAGARPARPGEFTLRAFRSGRMDLLQAEAVADLVAAETEAARRLALRALRGGLTERVGRMKDEVLELLAHLETHLEFPMEDVEPMPPEELLLRAGGLRKEIQALLEMAGRREVYRRGLYTVLTGRRNVGKSRLFNRLLGRERALVTEHPGTTRDTLEETVRIGGLDLCLVDTAGGREGAEGSEVEGGNGDCEGRQPERCGTAAGKDIEMLGIERAIDAARRADLVWFLIDVQDGVTAEDEKWLESVLACCEREATAFFLLVNKIDLLDRLPGTNGEAIEIAWPALFLETFPPERRFHISAKTGEGIDHFLAALQRICSRECRLTVESDLLVNERQERTLEGMLQAFGRMDEAIQAGLSLDVVATDLWDVKNALDQLDGSKASNDLLGEIFSRFCVGK